MLTIRSIAEADWDQTWAILEPVFRAGETYPSSPEISKEQAHTAWIDLPTATYVAEGDNGEIVGCYYIRPNQPTLGAHVCNCGYVVAEHARGQGIATEMCKHSQDQAVKLGFRAMQFNLVVATNVASIRVWQKQGFETVGRLPKAFKHAKLGYVDAFVMYKQLVDAEETA